MRKALVLFLFLFCAARLHAQAPTFAQVSPVATFSNSQTCTATFSGSNIAGNALFFLVSSAGNTNVQSVTDQFADKYISLFGAPAIVGGGSAVLEQGQALASGPNAITATFDSVQTATTCIAVEYSPASVVYLGLPGTAGFGTNIAQSGLGAGANNTLVNIAWAASPTATISASTSFTLRSGTGGLLVQDRANVSTGTYANGPTYPVISTSANWFSFFFSLALPAPTTTTVTGRILDLTQTPVSSGQVVFTLKPGVDTTMSGNARFTPAVVNCGISSQGLLQNINLNGPCVITMNTALIPSGTYYSVSIQPGNSPAPISGSFTMYATASSVDISTITPTPAEMPGYNIVDVFSNQNIGGNKTFTGIVTLAGGSQLIINGPLTAIDGGDLSGNFSGNPNFTGDPTFTGILGAQNLSGEYFVGPGGYSSLAAAMAAAPTRGVVIHENTVETFNTDPWASAPTGSCPIVIFGAGVWITNVPLKIPCSAMGAIAPGGNGLNAPTLLTSISAGPSFPSSPGMNPIIWETGVGSLVENITVTCTGANQSGFYATDINEQAGFIQDTAINCPYRGFKVDATQYTDIPAQSYILRDVQSLSGAAGSSSTIGVELVGNNGGGPAEVRSVTSSGEVGHIIGASVQCQGWSGGLIEHIHGEQSTVVLNMSGNGCPASTIIDVGAGGSVVGGQTVVSIPNTVSLGEGQNLLEMTLSGANTLISIPALSITDTEPNVMWLLIGEGGSSNYISSSASIGSIMNGGVTFLGGVGMNSGLSVAGAVAAASVKPASILVGSLPSAASFPGQIQTVSDSTTVSAEGQTCIGSSSHTATAISNGSVWKCF